jgi:DNA helicase-2/ATP-dependent DNA helicase PcrA
MDLSQHLNETQVQAVEHTEGPSMVIAGAGSGKTRVLTFRIAYLIHKGISPFNILALTFTNKAAREMKDRIGDLVGETYSRNLWMGTFHSVFARILRIESELLGYPNNFTIYDTDDSKRVIKSMLKERLLDDKVYKPNLVLHRISMAKNNLLSPEAYLNNATIQKEDIQSKKPELGVLYKEYQKRLFRSGAMDFDDLLFNMNILLRDHDDILYKYQDKFRYILVDEYQDTNFSQYLIVKALSARFENICVVGDDAQSIYSFRGANIQNILNFQRDYDNVKVFKLEQNYRSTPQIVEAANSLIRQNVEQIKKDVYTQNPDGEKIKLTSAISDNEEAMNVAYSIFHLKNTKRAHNRDFAILYRTNAQSMAMEDALRKLNIPYVIYGGLSFYQRKEIKDLLAYFRLVVNTDDDDALKRIINYPARGIGATTMDKLNAQAASMDQSLWWLISQPGKLQSILGKATINRINGFVDMIETFQKLVESKDAYEVGRTIATTTGLLREMNNDKSVEGVSRYENLQELLNSMKDFVDSALEEDDISLPSYLQDIPLLTDQDDEEKNKKDSVNLMTIHASKGLEFPYVYVTGLEENLFPSMLSIGSRSELEEERRLFYVALTRAEKEVHLSFAQMRYKWGNLNASEPSRFLSEIDMQYVDNQTATSHIQAREPRNKPTEKSIKTDWKKKNLRPVRSASASKNEGTTTLAPGNTVRHERFGKGKILMIEGYPPNQKATVDFETAGRKQLLLKFARLDVIS